jgi:hypothetical protein
MGQMQGAFAERTKKHFGDLAYALLDTVEAVAQEKGCTTGQVALGWCARQPGVTSPIIGPRTMGQLEDNLGALDDAHRRRPPTPDAVDAGAGYRVAAHGTMIDFSPRTAVVSERPP